MSYDKDKQAWYDKERRSKLVLAIIDKMDKTDTELIPALNRYIETGDETMFEEFNKFLSIKSAEEKAERLQHSEELLKTIEEVERRNNEYRKKYEKFIEEFYAWRIGVLEKLDEDIHAEQCVTLKNIKDTIEKMEESGMRQMKQRKLYVKVGDEIKRVDGIAYTDKKVVLEVGETLSFVTEPPRAPGVTLEEYEVIFNRGNKLVSEPDPF